MATAVAVLIPDCGAENVTVGVDVYPEPSLFKNICETPPVAIMGVAVAVMAEPTRVSDVIYPSSSTVLSTSSIAVSMSSFSYS